MPSNFLSAVIVGLLAAWLLLTGLWALPPVKDVLERRARFLSWAVPRWNLFAPVPGMHDFRVLARDELMDRSVTSWQELPVISERSGVSVAPWNPGQRQKKALFDVAQELAAVATKWHNRPDLVQLSLPYLIMLTYVCDVGSVSMLSRRKQFVLVQTSRQEPKPQVLLVSDMHDLHTDAVLNPAETSGL